MLRPSPAPITLKDEEEGAGTEYNDFTIVELKSIAENKGIKVNSSMKKSDIIQVIMESGE